MRFASIVQLNAKNSHRLPLKIATELRRNTATRSPIRFSDAKYSDWRGACPDSNLVAAGLR